MRHTIKLGYWRPALRLIGVKPGRAFLDVGDASISFTYGIFNGKIPRSNVAAAAESSWPLWGGVGLRYSTRKRLGLIGALANIVEIELAEAQPTNIRIVPAKYQRLVVSLEDPEAFLADLGLD